MIKLENFEVMGWEHAIRGMRNPMNSWDKSDSVFGGKFSYGLLDDVPVSVGENDHELMMKLRNAGTDHRKFMRMITVYVDITAPLYWWKEFDTYKVGTVANSCSTMHKITEKMFTIDDFSTEHLLSDSPGETSDAPLVALANVDDFAADPVCIMDLIIAMLNSCLAFYRETGDKKYWWQIIQLLPTSYNQKRTVMLNYEVLANIYKSRKNHKLDEWRELCTWIEGLPYSEIIIGEQNG